MIFNIEIHTEFGYDCIGCGHGNDTKIDVTLSEETSDILKEQIYSHGGKLNQDDFEKLIIKSKNELMGLKEAIIGIAVGLDIEYWLEVGDDDESGTAHESMLKDIDDGIFSPDCSLEEFCENEGYDTNDELFDEEEVEGDYYDWLKTEEYIPWLNTLSQADHANRVGLDIEATREECNPTYSITFRE